MVDYVDGPNRLIYLDATTVNASINPIDIYREVRTMRKDNENLRKFNNFIKGDGNVPKGGGKSTERYFTLLQGTRIVPYDISHIITVTGTLITDDGQEGVLAFDRTNLTEGVEVDINYVPPQVEVITVTTGSGVTEQDKIDITNQVWSNAVRTLTSSSGGSGATAQEIWEYEDRTLTEAVGGATAQEVWEYVNRSLTEAVGVDPQAVWEYGARTLTESAGLTDDENTQLMSLENYDDTEIKEDLERLKDYNEGNWRIIANQMIYYDRDGIEFLRFNLLDSAGQPISRGAMQRVAV